ncbi:MAG: helix-turn-helix transcriptional regulator, partial [Firmicutes bacterium]|nr:helix-turn-helix transcriptional regulator [Bacillota bacterium]
MTLNNDSSQYLQETASRIHELREIYGYSTEEMARLTEIDEGLYLRYESGQEDLPFTFIHKCALAFGVEIIDLMEGRSTR